MKNGGLVTTAADAEPRLHRAPESEKNVLGAILFLPEIFAEVKAIVRPPDFVDPLHQAAFREMVEIDRAKLPISVTMLSDRLRSDKAFAGVDMATHWYGVTNSVATAAHAGIYAEQIVEMRRKRQRVEALEYALADARNGHTSERIDQMLFATIDDWRREREAVRPQDIFAFGDLANAYPTMKSVLVESLVRFGEVINIIANTKVGKSWFVYYWALCIITGRYLFGRFACAVGCVVIVDNELHRETIVSRIRFVASRLGLQPEEYEHKLLIKSLRGNLRSFNEVAAEIRERFEPGEIAIYFFDAKYRFAQPGQSENDNASEAMFYNDADRFAGELQAAVAFIHHATKGSQSDKRVSDVGAGAGSQSRAADVHAVFREHEDSDAFVFEALVRSFPPVQPIGLRWEFPLWVPDDEVDPAMLKGRLRPHEQQQNDKDRDAVNKIVDAIRNDGPGTARQLRGRTGLSRERQQRLLDMLQSEGQLVVTKITIRGNECDEYSLPKEESPTSDA